MTAPDSLPLHAGCVGRPDDRPVVSRIIRRSTVDETTRPPEGHSRQDEASRAWNFHVALYYKAGGAPWRFLRNPLISPPAKSASRSTAATTETPWTPRSPRCSTNAGAE
ncbi:hypothetical protein AB0D59_38245 [Streptomyces sp. NPDC048417]|uniref:hypothetical protein n=1 Tax=Streptomyces sp. NPDC048417 TaxID=3155387 RepID=UPI0034184D0E